jgi:PRC-barrel domain
MTAARTSARRRRQQIMIFPADNIRDWRGKAVVDPDGGKIGVLEAVYVDTVSDEPSFLTVQVGMLGRHRLVFVPLDGATVGPDHVRVRYDKKLAREAPSIDMDGELLAGDEPAVFSHYGLMYSPGAAGERRLARR